MMSDAAVARSARNGAKKDDRRSFSWFLAVFSARRAAFAAAFFAMRRPMALKFQEVTSSGTKTASVTSESLLSLMIKFNSYSHACWCHKFKFNRPVPTLRHVTIDKDVRGEFGRPESHQPLARLFDSKFGE